MPLNLFSISSWRSKVKIYKNITVFDEALNRIRWIYDEFPNVVCSVSGGKDSTVIFHLTLQVAREKGRLPLKVMFLDQEAEWQATIDNIKYMMYHEDIEPMWLQVPIRLFNATSCTDHWLHCWDPKEEHRWVHQKDPIAIKENIFKEDRFKAMFSAILRTYFPDTKTAYIAGVRTEESPSRFCGLTGGKTYKWATWGNVADKKRQHFTLYPIYDWSYTDIWKAIHDNKWPYCKIYDIMYQYGIPITGMRVSNVHHETAVKSLWYLQEFEPQTYERLTQRIAGIDMAGKMGKKDYFVYELPFMFNDWKEYRDYLLEKLIDNEKWKKGFRAQFERHEKLYAEKLGNMIYKVHVQSILTNDWEFIKMANWERTFAPFRVRKEAKGERWY
jgi:predicted phosphoadenosine phosphosulfate sulfurtransferase